jgi:translocation protein SEC63
VCKERLSNRKKYFRFSWIRFGFFFKVLLVAFLWYLWYLTANEISNIKPLKSFDPYQILGVEPGADAATIKKTYRRLSLQKHPDKNPDDPLAVSEFIQITKAYTVSYSHIF